MLVLISRVWTRLQSKYFHVHAITKISQMSYLIRVNFSKSIYEIIISHVKKIFTKYEPLLSYVKEYVTWFHVWTVWNFITLYYFGMQIFGNYIGNMQ
jgi:hypothetical protein